jgi:HAD superfamily hydrolase (TIGR01509 family)
VDAESPQPSPLPENLPQQITHGDTASPRRFKAVFFDFDGVLIISEPIWWTVIGQVLRKHGRDITMRENGLRLGEAIRRQIPGNEELAALVEKEVREKAVPIIERHPLTNRRGIRKAVHRIARKGITIGVVSSSDSDLVERVLQANSIRKYFSVLIGGDDKKVRRGKPAPDCYVEAAKQAEVDDRSRCCVVEDSSNGIKAAKAAGMYVVQFGAVGPADKHADARVTSFRGVRRIILGWRQAWY